MTDTFSPGEIAIYVRPGSPHYGTEVTVTGPLFFHTGFFYDHISGGSKYVEELPLYHIAGELDPSITSARPENLKKKKPPARDIDKVVSWDDCLWKPAGVSA